MSPRTTDLRTRDGARQKRPYLYVFGKCHHVGLAEIISTFVSSVASLIPSKVPPYEVPDTSTCPEDPGTSTLAKGAGLLEKDTSEWRSSTWLTPGREQTLRLPRAPLEGTAWVSFPWDLKHYENELACG